VLALEPDDGERIDDPDALSHDIGVNADTNDTKLPDVLR